MKFYACCLIIVALLSSNLESCDRELTPEERDRIEKEWRQEQERERTQPPIEDWRQYIK
jgi:hypothetical protein